MINRRAGVLAPQSKIISDTTEKIVDEQGNLVTTRTVVTQTTETPEQVQAQADAIDNQIASLQTKKTGVLSTLQIINDGANNVSNL